MDRTKDISKALERYRSTLTEIYIEMIYEALEEAGSDLNWDRDNDGAQNNFLYTIDNCIKFSDYKIIHNYLEKCAQESADALIEEEIELNG